MVKIQTFWCFFAFNISMKKISIALFSLITSISFAQEQNVLGNSGGYTESANGSITWTVGEVVITTIESPDNHVTQGFNQSNINFVSVEDLSEKITLTVFPNPTTDYINVEASKKTKMSIYDSSGKFVKSVSVEKEDQVDLSELTSGTYILMFERNNKKVKSVKILVQK